MAWTGDSRRHSLARKGISTARGLNRIQNKKELKGSGKFQYLSEKINFGGEIMTRGNAIRIMQQEGTPQKYIDRYMQGAKTIVEERK